MNYCNIELTILFYKFYYKNETFKDKFKNTLPRNERNTALLVVMGQPVFAHISNFDLPIIIHHFYPIFGSIRSIFGVLETQILQIHYIQGCEEKSA